MRLGYLAVLCALVAHGSLADLAAPSGRVLITVSGSIISTNRGALEAGTPSLIGFLDTGFEAAAEFDQEMQDAMPQSEVTSLAPTGQTQVTYAGPRLMDVVTRLGAVPQSVSVMAADGYLAEISVEEMTIHTPILAMRMDGRLMGLGIHGPEMVVFPPTWDADIYEGLRSKQVWAVIPISED